MLPSGARRGHGFPKEEDEVKSTELKGPGRQRPARSQREAAPAVSLLWTMERLMPREWQRLAKPGTGLSFGSGGGELGQAASRSGTGVQTAS